MSLILATEQRNCMREQFYLYIIALPGLQSPRVWFLCSEESSRISCLTVDHQEYVDDQAGRIKSPSEIVKYNVHLTETGLTYCIKTNFKHSNGLSSFTHCEFWNTFQEKSVINTFLATSIQHISLLKLYLALYSKA